MTQYEWDHKWVEIFRASRMKDPTAGLTELHEAVTSHMNKKYGYRPSAEKISGPPWWTRLGAVALGVPMDSISKTWDFMNGKKTIVGAAITLLAYLVAGIPLAAALCTTAVCATTVAKVGGIGLTVVGVAHKTFKFIYREDHQ